LATKAIAKFDHELAVVEDIGLTDRRDGLGP